MSPMFIKHQHDKSVTVLTNLYVRAIVAAYLVPYLVDRHDVRDRSTAARIGALGNRALALGGDGWRRGHWLNIYRDVHHGWLEIMPCGEGVWEIREMQLRADWEWGELVYYDYWVKVRPIIELGNHERIDGGGSHGGGGRRVGGHILIWGGGG